MASAMPSFISRLMRPFSTSTSLGLNTPGSGAITTPEGAGMATIAAGCFWGVEHMFRKEFKGKGLYDARVGYIGGDAKSPSYRSVCSGQTGRMSPLNPQLTLGLMKMNWMSMMLITAADAEALQVTYDPAQITYRQLLEFFYQMHDPTTSNRQGPDAGSQYRSGIFYHDGEQESVAREVTKLVNEKWWKGKVVTEILPAGEWWDAEVYHQKVCFVVAYIYECGCEC
jgi:peptide-methionine (S)-S-oxide reductase